MTAANGLYQEWQSLVAYYHYKKLKAQHPCSDVGGFTRLLNRPNARPDHLMERIPTVMVQQLRPGRCDECDYGFVVMNRPWGLRQFVKMAEYRLIPEEYVFLMETDHLLLRHPAPLPHLLAPLTQKTSRTLRQRLRVSPAMARAVCRCACAYAAPR